MGEYFYGITDTGKRRNRNEDTFFVHETGDKKYVVACVIDGVGGYQGGELAAAIARSVIIRHLKKITEDVQLTLLQAVIAANARIQEQKKQGENDRMACVLTCAVIDVKNNKLWYAHVGDTRIYLLRDNSLVKISTDHSAIGFLEEAGRLSEDEAMRHPRRNEINKALGFEEDIAVIDDFVETGESPFLPGDMVLLCSDGLTDMINSATITSLLTLNKSISAKTKDLIDAANNAGGNDNITAVIIANNKQPLQKKEPLPVRKAADNIQQEKQVKEISPAVNKAQNKKDKKSPGTFLYIAFAFLLLILAVAFQKNTKPVKTIPGAVAEKKKDKGFEQLALNASDSVKKYSLLVNADPVMVSATINIDKDSFYLNGNGTTLISDSSFREAAFNISPAAKQIVIDSLVFKNFDIGVLMHRNNLVLKNVRFINCRVPIQYDVSLPDTVISGRFSDSIFTNHSKAR